MEHRRTCAALVLIGAAFGVQAASENTVAKILYTGTYGDGRLFVALDAQIGEPGCASTRFDVPSGHPQIRNWLAIALTASASGKNVVVRTNGCYGVYPTMSQNTDSWFYLQPN